MKTSLYGVGFLLSLYASVVIADIAFDVFGLAGGVRWAPLAMLLGLIAVAWWRLLRGSGDEAVESKRGTS